LLLSQGTHFTLYFIGCHKNNKNEERGYKFFPGGADKWMVSRARYNHDQQHCYHHAPRVKPEAATAVVELFMMGVRTPKTC
jgi:hypothetical protein